MHVLMLARGHGPLAVRTLREAALALSPYSVMMQPNTPLIPTPIAVKRSPGEPGWRVDGTLLTAAKQGLKSPEYLALWHAVCC